MDDRDILRKERLERVQTFGIENNADWPAASQAAARYANIDGILKKLDDALLKQLRTPVAKQTLLDALWLDFKNIARTARAIDLDEPGFAATYRLPDNPREQSIKTHADALLKLLEDNTAPVADGGDTPEQLAAKAALRAKFTDRFIPADFVTTLRADRNALDAKNTAKTTDNIEGLEGTAEINVQLETGGTEVIHLDAMMQNLYARNPARLHAWLAASRVERSPQKKKAGGTGATTTPPATPTPTP